VVGWFADVSENLAIFNFEAKKMERARFSETPESQLSLKMEIKLNLK
jgi:hypothetical protein